MYNLKECQSKTLLSHTGNQKIIKTNKNSKYRVTSLSLMPDQKLCPFSLKAGCFDDCLKFAGRGKMPIAVNARTIKSFYYHNFKDQFFEQLDDELTKFKKNCFKKGLKPAARLNVLSDILFENTPIIENHSDMFFYDYTKIAKRLGKTPKNYKLMFSYSGKKEYQKSVNLAVKTDNPIAVVFKDALPKTFLDRPVINGDNSDLVNVLKGKNKVIGLLAKGSAKTNVNHFVVDNNIILRG